MDWSHASIPSMRHEARFGDRVVAVFADRPKTVWAMVEAAAARNGDGEALVCGDKRLSWREVLQQSRQIAGGLHAKGLRPGDRIGVLLGNRIEIVLAVFAAARLGLDVVLLSHRQPRPEIADVLTACGAKLLLQV